MSAIPAVSVVLTVYNRARFAAEAIDSILAQTLADFELIIVDDGSTDNSPKVIADYAERDSRVAIVTQKNAGVAAARNAGAEKSRAKLIAFMDDDDISHPQRLQKQVDLMHSRSDIAACVCGIAFIGKRSPKPRKSAEIKSKWMWEGHGHLIRRDAYFALGGHREYFWRGGSPDPIEENPPLESLPHFIPELLEDYRIRLLHKARNAGRRMFASGEMNPPNLKMLIEFINLCGGGKEVTRRKKRRCAGLPINLCAMENFPLPSA